MSVHYPAQPTIHRASCPDAPDRDVMPAWKASAAYPYAKPHGCYSMSAQTVVVALPEPFAHKYDPCTIWPGGAVRPLCRTCRGTHEGDHGATFPHRGLRG